MDCMARRQRDWSELMARDLKGADGRARSDSLHARSGARFLDPIKKAVISCKVGMYL